ncbi:alpha-tocopherol transfer protein-like isoform X2 [Anthonomus grandis grandis]|uniref:alpha-tocopherol transfer protein-like isoform X2 n=1 Tax=Anthonomus grandis grandis TaxID=2921223 RepID=UPI0021665B6E|nr:alpha-tocopherol transfer protein-like isoform X2 [Anthonomus grandis grandis]
MSVAKIVMVPASDYVKQSLMSNMTEMPTVQLGNYTLQVELKEPNSKVQEIARKELRETPEVAQAAIKELRELLKEEKDLYVPLENDLYLTRFLRPTKFYPESARDLIKRYYAFKQKHANMFDGLTPNKERNIFEQNILTVQPNRDQFGRRILVIELGSKWKTDKVTLDEVFKGCVLFLETAMLEPETQVCGAVVIFDMNGLSLSQTTKFTPSFAARIVEWLQDSVPLRIKNIHVVNQPYIFKMVFALFKPFLREKLRSRIIFHGTNRKSLHEYVDPSALPEWYGGTLDVPMISGPQWLQLLEKCEAEFEAINSYGYKKKVTK